MDYRMHEFEWEEEVCAGHRWGAHGIGAGVHDRQKAPQECARLRRLYDEAAPLDGDAHAIASQIIALEVCNWRLEESIVALCKAIGRDHPVPWGVGHSDSLTPGRWQRLWAYDLALRDWLTGVPSEQSGYAAMLHRVDPTGDMLKHITTLLGEPTDLKRVRVERVCLHIEFWLDGHGDTESPHKQALKAAAEELRQRDADLSPNAAFEDGFGPCVKIRDNGQLQPCHHKLFRRYDILISSIGDGVWRRTMPYRGTDGYQRAELLEAYLMPIEAWIEDAQNPDPDGELAGEIHTALGKSTAQKRFLAALLASLLRAQQELARTWAREAAAMRERDGQMLPLA